VEEVTEAFPGVSQWQKFGEACEKAEGYRDLALEEAKRKLHKLVNSIPGWTVCAPHRIKAAAEARYEASVKDAQEQCEAACLCAQKELFEALDRREAGA
jgi:hypothetical protein